MILYTSTIAQTHTQCHHECVRHEKHFVMSDGRCAASINHATAAAGVLIYTYHVAMRAIGEAHHAHGSRVQSVTKTIAVTRHVYPVKGSPMSNTKMRPQVKYNMGNSMVLVV